MPGSPLSKPQHKRITLATMDTVPVNLFFRHIYGNLSPLTESVLRVRGWKKVKRFLKDGDIRVALMSKCDVRFQPK